jgi:hypothetical protein
VDELIDSMSMMKIGKKYVLDQTLQVANAVNVTTLKLNFYQIWCMFGELPCVYVKGKLGLLNENYKMYEYKIQSQNPGCIFTLFAWNIKGSFLQETQWHIGSTTRDPNEIQAFMDHLLAALQCYSDYYKGVERHIFESEYPEVDQQLKIIKRQLIQNREILKKL